MKTVLSWSSGKDSAWAQHVTCVDPTKLPDNYAGREWNTNLIHGLPVAVDPCRENGEFHTFVYDWPTFAEPIRIADGEVVERDGFVFADLLSVARTGKKESVLS